MRRYKAAEITTRGAQSCCCSCCCFVATELTSADTCLLYSDDAAEFEDDVAGAMDLQQQQQQQQRTKCVMYPPRLMVDFKTLGVRLVAFVSVAACSWLATEWLRVVSFRSVHL